MTVCIAWELSTSSVYDQLPKDIIYHALLDSEFFYFYFFTQEKNE